MTAQNNNHLLLQLEKLEEKGYTDQLKFANGNITDIDQSTSYTAKEIVRIHEYCF